MKNTKENHTQQKGIYPHAQYDVGRWPKTKYELAVA